jgi:hypothetical protein
MAVLSNQVTATSVPTPLFVGSTQIGGAAYDALPVIFKNTDSTNTIWLGNSAVTTSTGYPLAAGASLPFQFLSTEAQSLYGCTSGSLSVTVAWLASRQ